MTDSTQRFSSRVADYVKYRPTYPPALIELLKTECSLTPASTIADTGSGTGILSKLFLDHGNVVFGIEPNIEMRRAGEELLSAYPNFHSVAATAEATSLSDHSVDFVTAGQAFHWFDHRRVHAEFKRILKPDGWVVLVWNDRRIDSSPFLVEYEQLLLNFATDYEAVNHKQVDERVLRPFFGGNGVRKASFPNSQTFDFEGLRGRLLSSSYAPEQGHPDYQPMLQELERIFGMYQSKGNVIFEYITEVYYGHLLFENS
jgi:SAM-dependent methyltransferase